MAEGQRYRRRSLGALVGAGLFAPALLRAQPATELTPTERRLYDAAKAKQEQVTWYISHYSGETAQAIGRAFDETFPGIKANVVRTTAQVAFQRLSQEHAGAARMQVDVLQLDRHRPLRRPEREGPAGEIRARQPPAISSTSTRTTIRTASSPSPRPALIAIGYNTAKLKPKQTRRRTGPTCSIRNGRTRSRSATPAFSGYVGTWVVTLRKLYGWDFFEKLAKNNPQIGRSINDTVTMLNCRRALVAGSGPNGTAMESADKGNPLA